MKVTPHFKKSTWYSDVWEALQKAKDEGRTYVILGSAGEVGRGARIVNYATLSDSEPDAWYQVSVYQYEGERLKTCGCKSYRYRENCDHLDRVP